MRTLLLAVLLLLTGCDQLKERAGIRDPARVEAEGKAIGGACRHAGRGLEDCYQLHPDASIPAIYAGWKEMTEYMAKNNIEAVEPTILPEVLRPAKATPKKKKKADGEESDAPTPAKEKDAGH